MKFTKGEKVMPTLGVNMGKIGMVVRIENAGPLFGWYVVSFADGSESVYVGEELARVVVS